MHEPIQHSSFDSDEEESNQHRSRARYRARNETHSQESDTFDGDDTEVWKMTLIQQYARGRPTTNLNESTMRSITRTIRLVIIPKVKFLLGGTGFGSFHQPDFTNPNCWVNKVYDRIANLKNASDRKKADIWMTYRNKIKEQFSLHCSGTTLKIKKAFLKGEWLMQAIMPLTQK